VTIAEALNQQPVLLSLAVGILGLIVGSFLNVVIFRLPAMMERAWRRDCHEFLGLEYVEAEPGPFNLIVPRSRCPVCHKTIGASENIPLFSYVALKGRCATCRARIPLRYPLVELLSAILSALIAWRFGFVWQTLFALILGWSLICLSFIDIDHQLLPDSITLPLLWLGLLLSLFDLFADSTSAIIGAAAGYASLWSIYQAFRLTTGKEGMGYGDFKLLAMLGAWLGWQMLPLIVVVSSLIGAIVGTATILLFHRDRSSPVPFGPYLALAGCIGLLWGDRIIALYLHTSGVNQ
jgi:leader peptidase (prepilin peptidase)/N-methyltransferase